MPMQVLKLHEWDVSTAEARQLQRDLAASVVRSRCLTQPPRYVAGVDVGLDRIRNTGRAAVVVLSFPSLELVEVQLAEGPLTWPYVPGLLSFREVPLALAACELVQTVPDIMLVDGHGIAHPRRLGLASHLGLCLELPTVGCAKSLLCGNHDSLSGERGATSPVVDGGEVIGAAVRTKTGVKPVYVSIGHRCGFADAVESVLQCTSVYRLPEPTRLAHLAAGGRLTRPG
jgi:deoxyribonuclease V